MQRVHITQDFPESVASLYAYLSEHENLGPLFGARIRRLSDGEDGTRNGVGSAREMRVGPLPPFVETVVEAVPDQLIRYRITRGGVLKDHEGIMRFAASGAGSRLDYTIVFDGKLPGLGPLVALSLRRSISAALRKRAAGR